MVSCLLGGGGGGGGAIRKKINFVHTMKKKGGRDTRRKGGEPLGMNSIQGVGGGGRNELFSERRLEKGGPQGIIDAGGSWGKHIK